MNSLTDPQGIKDAVNAIFAGGSTHPLADLARLIDCAISDAQFQGLGSFDVARWVAHAITEDQKARLAYSDATAPHGQFVPKPPAPKVPTLSVQALSEVLRPNPSAAARALIDQMGPGEFQRLKDKHLTTPTPTEAPTRSATTPDPKLSAEALGMIQQSPRPGLFDFLNDLPPAPKLELPRLQFEFGTPPKLPMFDLSDEMRAEMKAAGERFGEVLKKATNEFLERDREARTEAARKLLAEQPHEHIYGRGSNGICRICGHESNSRRQRAKRRAIHNEKAKAARQYPQHVPSEKVTYTKDGDAKGLAGTVLIPADHNGMVLVAWETGAEGLTPVQHISAPESRLYEALKSKGNGGHE